MFLDGPAQLQCKNQNGETWPVQECDHLLWRQQKWVFYFQIVYSVISLNSTTITSIPGGWIFFNTKTSFAFHIQILWCYSLYTLRFVNLASSSFDYFSDFRPILDDRSKKKSLKGVLSIHNRVCARTTGDTFWPTNQTFGLSHPWDMRKKRIVLFFEIFIWMLLLEFFVI